VAPSPLPLPLVAEVVVLLDGAPVVRCSHAPNAQWDEGKRQVSGIHTSVVGGWGGDGVLWWVEWEGEWCV
jgi:hypothetical protein